jgi:hypothetical protein
MPDSEDRNNLTGHPGITWLLLIAAVLPAIAAYAILYRQAFPAPYQDDYKAILSFAVEYAHLPTLKAKVLHIATDQSNEYKLSFEHSIVASELELTRHLNFPFLIALGNLFLLPILYLVWLIFQQDEPNLNRRLLAFLPISLVFFSLTYWENLDWAMTGLQNTPVILFSLLAVYLLASRKIVEPGPARFLLACLTAVLAASTSANGFLLVPVGLLVLLPRRAYVRSLVWCASFLLPLAAYLYHYTRSAQPPMFRLYYITRPLFFLAFFGCVIPSRWYAAELGFALLSIVLLAWRSGFHRRNPAAFYSAVWIVATGALVGWVRGSVAFSTAPRYSIYSILMLIFCYSYLAEYLPSRWPGFNRKVFYIISLLLAVGMCVSVDRNAYQLLGVRRRMVVSGIEWYRANPQANSPMVDPLVDRLFPQEKAREHDILNEAIQEHIYTLPPRQDIH